MNIKPIRKGIDKISKNKKSVFIMGHSGLDLDALGSLLGLYEIFKSKKKDCYLVIDDRKSELGVSKVLKAIKNDYKIIKSKNIKEYLTNQDLLIIADTNKKKLLSNTHILNYFDDIIVIDHHETSNESIRKAYSIIESLSSTCEIVAELLRSYRLKLSPYINTLILSGIVLDTNNFILKTTSNTHDIASYLIRNGADIIEVQYLLKQDFKEYIERQKVINEAKIIKKEIALTKGLTTEIYRKEDLAKISTFLLLFEHIELSIVIGKINKKVIGISARSSGKYDVNKLLKPFNGGGNVTSGAAQIKGKSLEEIFEEMRKLLKKL
jgi:c-di-AMP phosphodiesterase-like protein